MYSVAIFIKQVQFKYFQRVLLQEGSGSGLAGQEIVHHEPWNSKISLATVPYPEPDQSNPHTKIL